ncbi:MAG: DUF429 domain-containing protein [Brevinematales bacterium]|nr:DUF429 domain-containing protein [Brevinematales bacterium]
MEDLYFGNVVGIDLAGSPNRRTGVAYFDSILRVYVVYSDEEILNVTRDFEFVFVDSPLSIPAGRDNLNENNGIHFRECDRKLRDLGIKFFPVTLGPMRILTERGIGIKNKLESMGKMVFETFPGAVYDRFGVGRKNKVEIIKFYQRIGFDVDDSCSQDELDAVACLLVGIYYLQGKAKILEGVDGSIVII